MERRGRPEWKERDIQRQRHRETSRDRQTETKRSYIRPGRLSPSVQRLKEITAGLVILDQDDSCPARIILSMIVFRDDGAYFISLCHFLSEIFQVSTVQWLQFTVRLAR